MANPKSSPRSAADGDVTALQSKLDHADAAFASLQGALADIDPDALTSLKGDLQRASIAALAVALWAQTEEPHARFASASKCEALRFDLALIARLESAALAGWYTRHHALLTSGTASEAKVPAALDGESLEVRNRMFKCAEYNLDDDVDEVKVIEHVRAGNGYLDRANDLYALANVYKRKRSALSADGRNWRADDEKRARRLHAELLRALGLTPGADGVDWVEMSARAWHLLRATYAEVEAVGRCLYRHENPDKLFPNLVTVSRDPRSPAKPEAPPAPDAPHDPAKPEG